MFQVEPILWLQSLEAPPLTALCRWLSELGTSIVYRHLAVAIAFGLDLRRGLVLLHVLLWNGVATHAAKALLALPRPYDADAAVRFLGRGAERFALLYGGGARSFFALPSAEAIELLRAQPGLRTVRYGFPSGHVSAAVAFWSGLGRLFRSRAVRATGEVFALLMAGARVYLGAHFVADVVGGAALGLAIAWGAPFALRQLRARAAALRKRWRAVAVEALPPFAAVALLPWIGNGGARVVGALIGFHAAQARLAGGGTPVDAGRRGERAARAGLAVAVLAATHAALEALLDGTGALHTLAGEVLLGGVPLFLCLDLTRATAQRLGWLAKPLPERPSAAALGAKLPDDDGPRLTA